MYALNIKKSTIALAALAGTAMAHPANNHKNEHLVLGFELDRDHLSDATVRGVSEHTARVQGESAIVRDPVGESLQLMGPGLDGDGAYLLIADKVEDFGHMPVEEFTATAWVRIDKPTRWGGILSAVSDNGDREKGWILGYDNDSFTFGISTTGADDGNGNLTYISGQTKLIPGNWYMVTATFDGESAKLYVNGELDAQTADQHGQVLYEQQTPLAIGAYIDSNELHTLEGRVRNVYLFDEAISSEQISAEFARNRNIAEIRPESETELEWTVEPFLCYATQTGVSIVCELPVAAEVRVRYRPAVGNVQEIHSSERAGIHTLRVEGLEPGEPYYYEVIAESPDGTRVQTDPMSFQTAVERGKAFTFVMIGDTQSNPDVVKRVSDIAWSHRPNFVSIAGDLVTTGTNKLHWTNHFFPNMRPLINRVPMFPILGNHEQNARHYYEYMDLPDPEYFYCFSYGDADYFMLDSEKPMGPGSEQYIWLEDQLSGSEARWKFVVHHRPPYSSDENDHGNSWLGPTTLGDGNTRQMVPLYEKYGVDIVFNGHVHVYERTFPLRDGEAVEHNGVIYMTIGGGGGGLEDFTPFNPWFGSKKVSTHHICYVEIVGGHLRMQAIDDQGRLFDQIEIRK
ncbi:MAG: LamG-like jellyroll fold domain-containing protein [Phycisphaerales bacterium]